MTLKKQYPIADHWLHLKLTLNRGCAFTEDEMREYLALFGGGDVEIAHIDVSRNPVVAVYRQRDKCYTIHTVRLGMIRVRSGEKTDTFFHEHLSGREGKRVRFYADHTVRSADGKTVICTATKAILCPLPTDH